MSVHAPAPAESAQVLAALRRHACNSLAHHALSPGLDRWLTPTGEGAIGYRRAGRFRVAAGGPICAPEALVSTATAFARASEQAGFRVCYFGVGPKLAGLLLAEDHVAVPIGAQPVWDPQDWPAVLSSTRRLRSELARATGRGITVSSLPPEAVAEDRALTDCLAEWRASRRLPPLGFVLAVALDALDDRRVLVARCGGSVCGFLVAAPLPARRGWAVEHLVRHPDAPAGTMELLVDGLMRGLQDDGARYATLGLAPLSGRAPDGGVESPAWLRMSFALTRAWGGRLYNFDGLEAFKAKFRPRSWEPVYAVEPAERFSASALYAIAGAFSGGAPLELVARGVHSSLASRWRRRGPERTGARAVTPEQVSPEVP